MGLFTKVCGQTTKKLCYLGIIAMSRPEEVRELGGRGWYGEGCLIRM